MSLRDELQDLIDDNAKRSEFIHVGVANPDELAALIRADGWRKPRTVTTVAELEKLPMHSVVRTHRGGVFTKFYDMYVESENWEAKGAKCIGHEDMPATVLHEPGVTV